MAQIWNSARRHLRLGRGRAVAHWFRGPAVALVSGSGDDNLGDELMLEATRRILDGVRLLPIDHPATERRFAKIGLSGSGVFSGLLLGGGTLVNPHFERLVSGVIQEGIPAWALGTGVGSSGFGMAPEVDSTPWSGLLSRFQRIWVRGPLSAERLGDLGLEVRVCGDLALAHTPPRPLRASESGAIAVNLGSSRVRFDRDGGIHAAQGLASAVKPFRDEGRKILPFAMHRDDLPALEAFQAALGEPLGEIAAPRTLASLLSIFETAEAVVGVRLHAGVMAWASGVPALMVAYRDKCLDFARHLRIEDALVSMDAQPPEIWEGINRMLDEGRPRGELVHAEAVRTRSVIESAAAEIRKGLGRT